jgi:signal transduction histidine kinase
VVVTLADLSSQRLVQVAAFQEQERRLLGIEVHDVSQPLVGLSYQLQAQGLTHSAEVARQLLGALRNLMFDLRTPNLESLNLRVSLTDFMQEVAPVAGLHAQLELDPGLDQVSGLPALFAYRIVVEGMSNVRRHAQATRVRLRLRLAHGQLRASLWDDGVGPQDPTPGRRCHGLEGISARAELLGGWARLRSSLGRGTLLHFRLPLEDPG